MWVNPGWNMTSWAAAPATAEGIIESTADIFYFTQTDDSPVPLLEMVYMYNSTDAMQA